MLSPDQSTERSTELKKAFQLHLPERVAAIEESWQGLAAKGWNSTSLRRLYQQIQELAGASGKFGLVQVSENAFSLELYFQTLISSRTDPAPHQIREIGQLLQGLKGVAQGLKRPPEEALLRPLEKKPRIFYLRLNNALAPSLSGVLEGMNCSVLTFHQVDDLLHEFEKEAPQTIVIDTRLLPSVHTLTDRLKFLTSQQEATPPLVFLSASNALDIRLSAMRTGAAAFFVAPVDNQAVATRIRQLATGASSERLRIMIVDDDPSQADFAAAILRKSDMETCTVTEPMQVLNTLETFRPDLVLMDLYMPGADGKELTSIIREQDEFVGVPIVFLSGEQDADKQLDALSAGGDDFIAKPIRPRHLIATINNRMQRVRALQRPTDDRARRDPVTGLYNRRHFYEQLDGAVVSADRHATATGLIVALVDEMDEVQAQVGGNNLEGLLSQIGSTLAAHAEPQDTCARISADSFAVLATRPLEQELIQLARTLVQAVSHIAYEGDQALVQPTLSAGLCLATAGNQDPSTLISRAIRAGEQAQQGGGNRVQIYRAGVDEPTATRSQDLPSRVRNALRESGLQVVFQAYTDARDRSRECYGMALRLGSDSSESVSAAEIIAAAKQAAVAKEIDSWLFQRALDVLQEHRQAGQEIALILSQSAETLEDSAFLIRLRDELRRRRLVGTGLVIELSLVDAATNPKMTRERMLSLNDMGIDICLGRFGHNENSYKLLQYLGAPYIKVVEKLIAADSKLIAALAGRARDLGARVILPQVDKPETIAPAWLEMADLLQSNRVPGRPP